MLKGEGRRRLGWLCSTPLLGDVGGLVLPLDSATWLVSGVSGVSEVSGTSSVMCCGHWSRGWPLLGHSGPL